MSQVLFFDYSKVINPLNGVRALLSRLRFEKMIPEGGSVEIKLYIG